MRGERLHMRKDEVKMNNEKDLEESAVLYAEHLDECGCAGICALYDSCSCGGCSCDACGVFKDGLCIRRALTGRRYPQLREPDGGDYRSVAGDELNERRRENRLFDAQLQKNSTRHVMDKSDLEDVLRTLRLLGKKKALELEWKDLSLDNVLGMYPHIHRRENRIEIQMAIYSWMNYRNDIDVHHMAERFGLSVRMVNKYFKGFFGVTFPIFLHKIRSIAAKKLFMIDNLRMGEISEILGYKTNYHFSVNFKRVEGMSPSFYKSLYLKRKGVLRESEIQNLRELDVVVFEDKDCG